MGLSSYLHLDLQSYLQSPLAGLIGVTAMTSRVTSPAVNMAAQSHEPPSKDSELAAGTRGPQNLTVESWPPAVLCSAWSDLAQAGTADAGGQNPCT